jgi:hypothetical protein
MGALGSGVQKICLVSQKMERSPFASGVRWVLNARDPGASGGCVRGCSAPGVPARVRRRPGKYASRRERALELGFTSWFSGRVLRSWGHGV